MAGWLAGWLAKRRRRKGGLCLFGRLQVSRLCGHHREANGQSSPRRRLVCAEPKMNWDLSCAKLAKLLCLWSYPQWTSSFRSNSSHACPGKAKINLAGVILIHGGSSSSSSHVPHTLHIWMDSMAIRHSLSTAIKCDWMG